MAEKFNLSIGGLISIPIEIEKSYDSKPGFKQAVDGKIPNTIKVFKKPDVEKVNSVDDIERVVSYSELKSHYQLSKEELIEVDAKAIKKSIAHNSSTMGLVRVIPKEDIALNMMDGSHYFLGIQKDAKTKTISKEHELIYSMIHKVLTDRNEVMLTSFTNRNIEKYGVIHPTPEGLRLSLLIKSDLQRPLMQSNLTDVTNTDTALIDEKLFPDHRGPHDDTLIEDNFTPKLKEAIMAIMNGQPLEFEEEEEATPQSNILDLLRNL